MENNLKVAKVKYSVSQMTSAFIILLAIYIFRSRILFFLKGNNGNLIRSIVAFAISLICSYFAYNYAGKSLKIFNRRIKQGKVLWLTTIYSVSVFILYACGKVSQWVQAVHKPLIPMITIFLMAIAAGFCEEFLFRGLLFNIFTKLFEK